MRPSRVVAALIPAVVFALTVPAWAQQASRPTPQQSIIAALRPIEDQLSAIHATEPERSTLGDITARAEAFAASLVEARHHRADDVARSLERRIELLARIARGRIEAARASDESRAREQTALAADSRRTQARAALDRVVERRVELDRPSPAPATPAGPPAPPTAAAPPTPPTRPRAPAPPAPPARSVTRQGGR